MLAQMDDVGNRQTFSDQEECDFVLGNMCARYSLILKDVLDEDTGVKNQSSALAVADFTQNHHLPWKRDLYLLAASDGGREFQAQAGSRYIHHHGGHPQNFAVADFHFCCVLGRVAGFPPTLDQTGSPKRESR